MQYDCVENFAENLKHFYLGTLIPLFCLSFSCCGPCSFYKGHVKNCDVTKWC